MYSTYAMFTASVDVGEFVNLTSSLVYDTNVSEYERLTINPGEIKTIELNINNMKKIFNLQFIYKIYIGKI